MKKFIVLALTFAIITPSSQNNPLVQALLNNDSERLIAEIQKNPLQPIPYQCIQEAVISNCSKTVAILTQRVTENPELLEIYEFRKDLRELKKLNAKTLLMLAINCSTLEAVKNLLSIPCVQQTIGHTTTCTFYDYRWLHRRYNRNPETIIEDSALTLACNNNSDFIETLLNFKANLSQSRKLSEREEQLLQYAQQNIAQKDKIHRYHAYLQKTDPSKKIPKKSLKIIRSFLISRTKWGNFSPKKPQEESSGGMGGSMFY